MEVAATFLALRLVGPLHKSILVESVGERYVECHIIRTHIGEIVFDVRKEDHPCSLCARMRRGLLHDTAKELNCNSNMEAFAATKLAVYDALYNYDRAAKQSDDNNIKANTPVTIRSGDIMYISFAENASEIELKYTATR